MRSLAAIGVFLLAALVYVAVVIAVTTAFGLH
jgi:hypothetical protein